MSKTEIRVLNIEDVKGNEFFKLRKDLGYSYLNEVYRIMEAYSNGNITVKCKEGCMTKHISQFEAIFENEINDSMNIYDIDYDFEDNRYLKDAVIEPKRVMKDLNKMSFGEVQKAVNDVRKDIDDEVDLSVIEKELKEKFEYVNELDDVQEEIEDIIDQEENLEEILSELFENLFNKAHFDRIAHLVTKYSIDLIEDKDLFYDLMVGSNVTTVPFTRTVSIEAFDFVEKHYTTTLSKRYCDNIIYFIDKYRIDLNEDDVNLIDVLRAY